MANFRSVRLIAHAFATIAVVGSLASATLAADPPAAATASAPSEKQPHAKALTSGRWQGELTQEGSSVFILVELVDEGGQPRVYLTIPNAQAIRALARDVVIDGSTLSFSLDARGVNARFKGEVKQSVTDETSKAIVSNGTYVGTLKLGRAGAEPTETAFTLEATPDARQLAGMRRFETELALGGTKLPIALTIAEAARMADGSPRHVGLIDIPAQGLTAYPAIVSRSMNEDGSPRWTVRMPVGVDAIFDLAENRDGTLSGRFKQGPIDLPVTFEASKGKIAGEMKRPQMPKPPFPYTERNVTIGHRFGHSLAATLTIPERTPTSPAKFPAVVLISGSGPQDRDETLLGHKPFAVLADALARAGIAVLRYDDRGTGGSTGTFAGSTSLNFATDADEASEWLKSQPEIDERRVGLIGHSEGGLIAPIVTAWQWSEGLGSDKPIAFIVLLAGPGVTGAEILKLQMRRILEAEGTAPESVEAVSKAQVALIDAVVAPTVDEEAVRAAAMELARVQATTLQPKGDDTVSEKPKVPTQEEIEQAAAAIVGQMSDAWMGTFLRIDPRVWLATSPVPILAMNGELDTQVDADQNLPAIEAAVALGQGTVTTKRYPGLNHLFQPAKTGGVSEYAAIETTFDPAALKDLVDWVVATSKLEPRSPRDLRVKSPEERPRPTVELIEPTSPATPSAPVAPSAPKEPAKP
ncbi:MAG: alpha/beta fold hydrolase [Phycisphaerae bacterium]|nr:alpha/beta fold hydrolase [Phycisphaerae bacterium]